LAYGGFPGLFSSSVALRELGILTSSFLARSGDYFHIEHSRREKLRRWSRDNLSGCPTPMPCPRFLASKSNKRECAQVKGSEGTAITSDGHGERSQITLR
jgi:hypothetical protein